MSFDERIISTADTEQTASEAPYTSTSSDSFNKVANIIVETSGCNIEDVTLSSKLEVLGIDSLKAITVLFELEEAFDVEIPNEVIPTIITVQDIMDKVNELSNNAT